MKASQFLIFCICLMLYSGYAQAQKSVQSSLRIEAIGNVFLDRWDKEATDVESILTQFDLSSGLSINYPFSLGQGFSKGLSIDYIRNLEKFITWNVGGSFKSTTVPIYTGFEKTSSFSFINTGMHAGIIKPIKINDGAKLLIELTGFIQYQSEVKELIFEAVDTLSNIPIIGDITQERNVQLISLSRTVFGCMGRLTFLIDLSSDVQLTLGVHYSINAEAMFRFDGSSLINNSFFPITTSPSSSAFNPRNIGIQTGLVWSPKFLLRDKRIKNPATKE